MKKTIHKLFIVYWDALIASSIAFAFILLFTKHSGVGISPDSVKYLSTAKNISAHFTFTDYTNTPFVQFPLGYPIFLAVIQFVFDTSLIQILPIINGLIFAGVIFMTNYIFQQISPINKIASCWVLILIATSPALLEIYTMAWSETLFIFFTLLFFISINKYAGQNSFKHLLIAAIIASFAFSVRYVGITCVITGCIIILTNRSFLLSKKVIHLFCFGAVSILLPLINLVRNIWVSETYSGVRQKSLNSFLINLTNAADVIQQWFAPLLDSSKIGIFVLFFLMIAGLILIFYSFKKKQLSTTFNSIIPIFFLVYIGFMLAISTVSRFETLSSRLLSPIYIPIILLFAIIVLQLLQIKNRPIKLIVTPFILFIYGFAQYNHYTINAATWEGVSEAGIPGYTENQWVQSPIVNFIKNNSNKKMPVIFSNADDAIFFLTGKTAFALPHKDIPTEISSFKANKSFYLIWFFNGQNDDLIDLEYINQYKKAKAAWQFKDGIIYSY